MWAHFMCVIAGCVVELNVVMVSGLFVPLTIRTTDYSYHRLFVSWTVRTRPFVPLI